MTATHEFVVPRSIPITLLIILYPFVYSLIWVFFFVLQVIETYFFSFFSLLTVVFFLETATKEGLKSLSPNM